MLCFGIRRLSHGFLNNATNNDLRRRVKVPSSTETSRWAKDSKKSNDRRCAENYNSYRNDDLNIWKGAKQSQRRYAFCASEKEPDKQPQRRCIYPAIIVRCALSDIWPPISFAA